MLVYPIFNYSKTFFPLKCYKAIPKLVNASVVNSIIDKFNEVIVLEYLIF